MRIVASALLIVWGLLNIFAGLAARREQTSVLVQPAFVIAGALAAAGALGFWMGRRWAAPTTLCGLLGISGAALFSAIDLHGMSEIHWSHHMSRLAISCALFVVALRSARRARALQGV